MIRRTAAGVFILLFVATSVHFAAAQDTARWKRYRNSEYVFEIAYPPDWLFDDGYQNNYGKPPSAGQRPAYAGETRNLFGLDDLPPVVVPLLMLVREPFPMGGAERNPAAMG
jgi:hypothetical protein